MTKHIAWGTSKLLWLFLQNENSMRFEYVIDDFTQRTEFCGVPVRRSSALAEEKAGAFEVVVFAVSNRSLVSILNKLHGFGLGLYRGVHLYSDLFLDGFTRSVVKQLGFRPAPRLLHHAVAYTLNSRKLVHTTLCGSWLFLETLKRVKRISGDVAEVGCFEGGNALFALQSPEWREGKDYYLFDSFEGFPEPSDQDPTGAKKGDYASEKTIDEVLDSFAMYAGVKVCRGFVPQTFALVPPEKAFSLIFFDCDLYQPALDTCAFFWERLSKGGYMLIHDYFVEPGGFAGVRTAIDEFFGSRPCEMSLFWQNTMAVVRKP